MIKIEIGYLDNLIDGVRDYNYFKTIETKDRLSEVKDDIDDYVKLHDVGDALTEITTAAMRVKPSISNDQLIEMFLYIDVEAI